MSGFEELTKRIDDRQAVIGVVGLGFVGLPMSVAKAQAGYQVIGFDVDARKVDSINQGNSYIEDVPSAELRDQVACGRLQATTDFSQIAKLDAVSICVPTPIDQHRSPDLQYLVSALKSIAQHAPQRLLVILSSTTYPGTTMEVAKPILESTGKTIGHDLFLAYSPERIDPGNKNAQIKNIPRVVGGATEFCTRLTASLYEKVLQERLIEVETPAIAEMAKIVENTFRLVNIGLMNELAVLSYRMGLDIWKVIQAASTKPYGFLPFYPGPGIGGHCIPVDPYYLIWKAREYQYTPQLIEKAGEINRFMPSFVVHRIIEILNQLGKSLNGAKVMVVGVAYKKNVADVRESPVMEIIHLLNQYRADWCFHDPYIPQVQAEGVTVTSVPLEKIRIDEQDIVFIATDHDSVDYRLIAEHAKVIFDSRNAMSEIACSGQCFKL